MTESEFVNWWYVGLAIAAVVVVLVAALLIAILMTARSILSNATKALGVAEEIVENTTPIWELQTTNRVAVDLLESARSIETNIEQVADVVAAPVAGRS